VRAAKCLDLQGTNGSVRNYELELIRYSQIHRVDS
jgi:hypothetical protein